MAAGTFDTFKIEITSADGGNDHETYWIAKDSRKAVKLARGPGRYGRSHPDRRTGSLTLSFLLNPLFFVAFRAAKVSAPAWKHCHSLPDD